MFLKPHDLLVSGAFLSFLEHVLNVIFQFHKPALVPCISLYIFRFPIDGARLEEIKKFKLPIIFSYRFDCYQGHRDAGREMESLGFLTYRNKDAILKIRLFFRNIDFSGSNHKFVPAGPVSSCCLPGIPNRLSSVKTFVYHLPQPWSAQTRRLYRALNRFGNHARHVPSQSY